MIWLSLISGYLIGSFLPAYFLTRAIVGIDIRTVGSFHAGTTNVFRTAGLVPAIITAIYDLSKGVIAIWLSILFGNPLWVGYLSGLCAVIGHIFPFYLQFRGGKGAATTIGLLFINLWKISRMVPFKFLLADLFALLFVVLIIFYTSKKGDVVGLFVLPALALLIYIRVGLINGWFALTVIGILFLINLRNAVEQELFKFKPDVRIWRVFIRPAAISLNYLALIMPRQDFLLLLGIVLLIFMSTDITRLMSNKANKFFHSSMKFKLYKEGEKRKISSMTLFLIGVWVTFFLFQRNISILSISLLSLSDLSAKLIGMSFGKRKIFHKTVEGTLAHLSVSVFIAYFTSVVGLINFYVGISGAAAATLCEMLPLSVDDNISVPLFSALTMNLWNLV